MAAYQKTSKGVGVDGVLRKLIFVIQYIYKYVYNIYTKYQAAAARPGPEGCRRLVFLYIHIFSYIYIYIYIYIYCITKDEFS